jgi:PPOX class probable F420-dependent enzyme
MAVPPGCVKALGEADVLSLATVRPDGRAHVVPVWFHWDGKAISVFSKADAQKVLNLLADPRAMIAVGAPGFGDGGGLLEVAAELRPAGPHRPAAGFGRKYRNQLDRLGVTFDDFLATYPMLICLRPTRWLDWGGPGWSQATHGAAPAVELTAQVDGDQLRV